MLRVLVSLPLCLFCAAAPGAGPETVTYPLEGFEESLPGCWKGRSEVAGEVTAEETVVGEGERAARITWDFTASPEPSQCFLNATINRELLGAPQKIDFWIHADEEAVGAPLRLWLKDPSQETFVAARTIEKPGPQRIAFPVAGLNAAWRGGDGNGKQDRPMRLFGLAVDRSGAAKGSIVIDDIRVTTLAEPREALYPEMLVALDAWGPGPVEATVRITNYASRGVGGLVCDISAYDRYYDRIACGKHLEYGKIDGGGARELSVALDIPYGAFRLDWTVSDAQGVIVEKAATVSHLMPACGDGLSDLVEAFERRWNPAGGVFGFVEPLRARRYGARWIRFEHPSWGAGEMDDGRLDVGAAIEDMGKNLDAGVQPIVLQTLYHYPEEKYSLDEPAAFARGYGDYMHALAAASEGLCRAFELGNEDNGPTKTVYSEIARHGLAGTRKGQPNALITNSGTAHVDVSWLKMQAKRGILDGMDALTVHPYTSNTVLGRKTSAAHFNIYGQLDQVWEQIDELGGMKNLWATEYGWINGNEEEERWRAELYPRHFMVGVAAGLTYHGLYTWRRDYGVINHPAGVAMHALIKRLEGRRFAGLTRKNDIWLAVWEKAGQCFAGVWAPDGKGEIALAATAKTRVFDLFGNPVSATRNEESVTLALGYAPVYVVDPAESVLRDAIAAECTRARERFGRCLARLESPEPGWAALSKAPAEAMDEVAAALRAWNPATRVSRGEQAVVAQALRWLLAGAAFQTLAAPAPGTEETFEDYRALLSELGERDEGIPALRWLLEHGERLRHEERMAREAGALEYAKRLNVLEGYVLHLCGSFARYGDQRFFAVWPYLFRRGADGSLDETLEFVPGVKKEVCMRVNSYAARDYKGVASLELPEGWVCEPAQREVRVAARGETELSFQVQAPGRGPQEERVTVTARFAVPDKPVAAMPFDDVEVLPSVTMAYEPLQDYLHRAPLSVGLTNMETGPVSGLLRIARESGDGDALASTRVENLMPGAPASASLKLTPDSAPPFSEWRLMAGLRCDDGRIMRQTPTLDFFALVQVDAPPAIDASLEDWRDALPLHIDQIEYTRESYGKGWSPEDCSAVSWLKCDADFVYFAARVRDQTFYQQLSGAGVWQQDSIQIIFAPDVDGAWTQFCLAFTPEGPQLWSSNADRLVEGGAIAVRIEGQEVFYEAAIPWEAIQDVEALEPGDTLRYGIAINDHDAIINRRFLERFIGSIVHHKDVSAFGEFRCVAASRP